MDLSVFLSISVSAIHESGLIHICEKEEKREVHQKKKGKEKRTPYELNDHLEVCGYAFSNPIPFSNMAV